MSARRNRQPAPATEPAGDGTPQAGRGRKRKNSDADVVDEASPAPKRGRGRARADSAASSTPSDAAADLQSPAPSTRTRGRPRANSNASSVASETASTVASAEKAPKRGRGRPRANSSASSVASDAQGTATVAPAADVAMRAPMDTPNRGAPQAVYAEMKDSDSPKRQAAAIPSPLGAAVPKAELPPPKQEGQSPPEEEDDFDESFIATAPAVAAAGSVRCPYLDTVCRPLLDFDMAKVCSVTLSDQNVYACLVCGKFFQGRGKSTPLYTHSVQCGHFVVMSLHTGRAYCLPEGYEIGKGSTAALVADARSLSDVQRCLQPSFAPAEIKRLNRDNTALARDVHGVSYLPGFVGLNNLSHTDYVSVALHALSHVTPIRDFFLVPSNYSESKSPLVHSFGEVMRKIWSSHNFKSVVSPQEFLQQVSVCSKKRFTIGRQEECIEFMVWLLNELHRGIGGTHRPGSSVIHTALQGQILVTSMTKRKKAAQPVVDDEGAAMEIADQSDPAEQPAVLWDEAKQVSPFLYLSVDIPPTPLFKDSQGGLVIPQIPLFEVLKKFDGRTWTDTTSNTGLLRRKYSIQRLPKYLMLHLVRFTKNNFYVEKNPSIVTFPITNLDMKQYARGGADDDSGSALPKRETVSDMGIPELRATVGRNIQAVRAAAGGSSSLAAAATELSARLQRCIDRAELEGIATDSFDLRDSSLALSSKYDLLCNICHDSMPSQGTDIGSDQKSISGGPTSTENVLTQGSYRCHVQNKSTGQWFEVQDLHVTETMPQLIGLSESYILIYERKDCAETC